ncbi:MAG: hypothetical protein ACI4OJ_09220 [Lachnospiraceae bacterium]
MKEMERYQRAVSALHPDPSFRISLQKSGKVPVRMRRALRVHAGIAAACWILTLSLGGAGVYASDIGGIQRKIQILQQGELTDAVLTLRSDDGTYAITDPSGKVLERGGGVAIEEDGTERPLTSSEMQEDLSDRVSTEVTDGHYYLSWRSHTFDLTKAFSGRDVVFLTLKDGTDTLYVTALSDGAAASSPNRYPIPGTDFDNG